MERSYTTIISKESIIERVTSFMFSIILSEWCINNVLGYDMLCSNSFYIVLIFLKACLSIFNKCSSNCGPHLGLTSTVVIKNSFSRQSRLFLRFLPNLFQDVPAWCAQIHKKSRDFHNDLYSKSTQKTDNKLNAPLVAFITRLFNYYVIFIW